MIRRLGALLLLLLILPYALCIQACAQSSSGDVLLTLQDGEQIPYAPYQLYMDVTAGIARYSARQGIAFTLAMEAYLQANNVILGTDEFLLLCGDEMQDFIESDTFIQAQGILKEQGGLDEDAVVRCVWENYWSQYVARMLSGFFNAQAAMHEGDAALAQQMFNAFSEEFYANFSFSKDDVAVFDGEAIAWTDVYQNVCLYNEVISRLQTANTIACSRSIQKYLEERQLETDLTDLSESMNEAVSAMKTNEIYHAALELILEENNSTLEDFLEAMKPFAAANFERAAFGQHCYAMYQELSEAQRAALDMETYYYHQLDETMQSYTVSYLGW